MNLTEKEIRDIEVDFIVDAEYEDGIVSYINIKRIFVSSDINILSNESFFEFLENVAWAYSDDIFKIIVRLGPEGSCGPRVVLFEASLFNPGDVGLEMVQAMKEASTRVIEALGKLESMKEELMSVDFVERTAMIYEVCKKIELPA